MKILLSYRTDIWKDRPVECYSRCYVRMLRERGHLVREIGEGHGTTHLDDVEQSYYDLFLEIENGRSQNGKLRFQLEYNEKKIPSAVVLIDSHGHPDQHAYIAPMYDHVFFAVWRRRDLFTDHPSVHWCPNATDIVWFSPSKTAPIDVDVGFFGSKGGLDRADVLKEACYEMQMTYDVRQIGKNYRHRWPETCEMMRRCKYLFNKGQKHDGPNQRVMESMLCGKLLFNDLDDLDGMSQLFNEGEDFIGYTDKESLKVNLLWAHMNPELASKIAESGYEKVKKNHQIKNRVDQILEVFNANHG